MRILIASELRSYREVITATIQQLRPQHEVIAVDPNELDGAIVRLEPLVVLCSRLSPTVESHPRTWVLLYPDGQASVVICFDGVHTAVPDLDLESLVSIIDKTERLVDRV